MANTKRTFVLTTIGVKEESRMSQIARWFKGSAIGCAISYRLAERQKALPAPKPELSVAEQIIVGAFLQSFLDDFEGWKSRYFYTRDDVKHLGDSHDMPSAFHKINHALHHPGRDIVLHYYETENVEERRDTFYVDFVPISTAAGVEIMENYDRLKRELQRAKRIAREAEEAMALDDARWNVCEKFLGMKRDGDGLRMLTPQEKGAQTRRARAEQKRLQREQWAREDAERAARRTKRDYGKHSTLSEYIEPEPFV